MCPSFPLTETLQHRLFAISEMTKLWRSDPNSFLPIYFNGLLTLPLSCNNLVKYYAQQTGLITTEYGLLIIIRSEADLARLEVQIHNLTLLLASHLEMFDKKGKKRLSEDIILQPVPEVMELSMKNGICIQFTPELYQMLANILSMLQNIGFSQVVIYVNDPITIPIASSTVIQSIATKIGVFTTDQGFTFFIEGESDCEIILSKIAQMQNTLLLTVDANASPFSPPKDFQLPSVSRSPLRGEVDALLANFSQISLEQINRVPPSIQSLDQRFETQNIPDLQASKTSLASNSPNKQDASVINSRTSAIGDGFKPHSEILDHRTMTTAAKKPSNNYKSRTSQSSLLGQLNALTPSYPSTSPLRSSDKKSIFLTHQKPLQVLTSKQFWLFLLTFPILFLAGYAIRFLTLPSGTDPNAILEYCISIPFFSGILTLQSLFIDSKCLRAAVLATNTGVIGLTVVSYLYLDLNQFFITLVGHSLQILILGYYIYRRWLTEPKTVLLWGGIWTGIYLGLSYLPQKYLLLGLPFALWEGIILIFCSSILMAISLWLISKRKVFALKRRNSNSPSTPSLMLTWNQ